MCAIIRPWHQAQAGKIVAHKLVLWRLVCTKYSLVICLRCNLRISLTHPISVPHWYLSFCLSVCLCLSPPLSINLSHTVPFFINSHLGDIKHREITLGHCSGVGKCYIIYLQHVNEDVLFERYSLY